MYNGARYIITTLVTVQLNLGLHWPAHFLVLVKQCNKASAENKVRSFDIEGKGSHPLTKVTELFPLRLEGQYSFVGVRYLRLGGPEVMCTSKRNH